MLELCSHPGCFAQILCDLLSPAGEKVKEGLRETTHNSSPQARNKASAATMEHGPVQKQHGGRTTSAHQRPESQEVGPQPALEGNGLFSGVARV